jgi:hypothetical protein
LALLFVKEYVVSHTELPKCLLADRGPPVTEFARVGLIALLALIASVKYLIHPTVHA